MKKVFLTGLALAGLLFACETDDVQEQNVTDQGVNQDVDSEDLVTFDISITNTSNYFEAIPFSERLRDGESPTPGPLTQNNDQYQVSFQAVPGTKLTPVTMMGNSNDWFLAPEDFNGIDLWENGVARTGDIANELILFDLGTEADNLPEFFPPAGANVGPEDPNTLTRIVDRGGVRGDTYLTAVLDYEAGNGSEAGVFTLTMTAIMTPDPSEPASSQNGFVVTPGILVLHAQANPLFTLGEVDRNVGLEAIAEDGNPSVLDEWFHELGSNDQFLRLTSSYSVFSPTVVYAFTQESDPWFTQGEDALPNSGVEEIAEDGNNGIAIDYLNSLEGVVAAGDNEAGPIRPGETHTFELTMRRGAAYKFGFGTMLVSSNDWFIAYNNAGFPLFEEDGTPISGNGATAKTYLYDAGTEIDQPVGFGQDQAPRQAGPNVGAPDPNTTVRRVSNLEDVQFGKGIYNNGPGVTGQNDPRGGYNVIAIEITPRG